MDTELSPRKSKRKLCGRQKADVHGFRNELNVSVYGDYNCVYTTLLSRLTSQLNLSRFTETRV